MNDGSLSNVAAVNLSQASENVN